MTYCFLNQTLIEKDKWGYTAQCLPPPSLQQEVNASVEEGGVSKHDIEPGNVYAGACENLKENVD